MKKGILILTLLILALFSMSCIYAADVNDTLAASEDTAVIEEAQRDDISVSDDSQAIGQSDDESVSAGTDSEILSAGEGNYTDLRTDIENGGNLTKSYYRYCDGDGDTIKINESMVINGKGAIIDMLGSNIQAFYVSASGVTFKNLTIKNAKYNGDSGAIYFTNSGTVEKCNFTNITAGDWGGAIMFYDGEGTIINCNFVNNTVSRYGGAVCMYSGTVENCNFADNAAYYGGAVYVFSNGTVTNCNFTNNAAEYGGAVYVSSKGTVTNCTFVNNTASEDGGAIYFYFGSTGTVENCNFADNAAYYGGAVFMNKGSVVNCNFTGNEANGTKSCGGAVYFKGICDAINCNFTNNNAIKGSGGAIYGNSNSSSAGCTFDSNSANMGGAMYYGSAKDCTFNNNTAKGNSGGAMYHGSAQDCTFNNNTAEGSNGAAMYEGSAVNCNFTNNSAYTGGAVCQGSAVNCTFDSNSAENGGAMYECSAVNCTFKNNEATRYGGAMYDGSAVNCTFTNNKVTTFDGGAISYGSATGCTFINNSASSGGALYWSFAENCTFIDNKANADGGAMSLGTAVNCTFRDNKANGNGGAMSGNGQKATNCDFINNTAKNGGATYRRTANNCTFIENNATEYGGAMYEGTSIECIFKDNKAGISGDDTYNTIIAKPNLIAYNFTSTYNSGDKLLFNLTSASGTPINNATVTIRVYKNNALAGTYYALSGDGWVVKLDVGSYIAVCSVENQAFDVDPVNATLNIAQSAVDLAASYTVSALDDGFSVNIIINTNPVINDNLFVKFNGKMYPIEVVNGVAKFTSNKVYSNTYNTDIFYVSSDGYNSSTTVNAVVKSTKVTQLNTFTYYYYNNDMGSDSEKGISKIKVVDIDGNPIKNGVVTITIMNKYKLKVKTDANGVAKFTKAYKPGTYSVTAAHNNKVTKLGNLVLKSVVNLPKVSKVSKSAKTTTIKITLKGTGPIKGKTVVVSFMKVNYKVQTDKNGVALFKVTKDMVSKLAVGKTYTVRATYRMDSVAQGIQILK